jgi:hypothetical protein
MTVSYVSSGSSPGFENNTIYVLGDDSYTVGGTLGSLFCVAVVGNSSNAVGGLALRPSTPGTPVSHIIIDGLKYDASAGVTNTIWIYTQAEDVYNVTISNNTLTESATSHFSSIRLTPVIT